MLCSLRSETRDAASRYGVDNPSDQGPLGSNHDEVRRSLDRELGNIGRLNGVHVGNFSDRRDARIAGVAYEPVNVGVIAERAADRVLTRTAADDKNVHDLAFTV